MPAPAANPPTGHRWWHHLRETNVPHAWWELAAMRLLYGWLVWRMLPAVVPYHSQPAPNGLGRFLDFTFLGDASAYGPLRASVLVALVLYAGGLLPLPAMGWTALVLVSVGTLENSQGAIGHHLQLTCLVACAQCVAYAAALGHDRAPGLWRGSLAAHRDAVQAAKLIIAAAYVASACVKLIASGGLWIWQLPEISLQLVKTHANVHYDTLWPMNVWGAETVPALIAAHPNLTRLFFAPGLLLELFAFLALTGRRAGFIIGGGLVMMHVLVRWVMQLSFSAHEWLLMIFFLNFPYLVLLAWRRWRHGGTETDAPVPNAGD